MKQIWTFLVAAVTAAVIVILFRYEAFQFSKEKSSPSGEKSGGFSDV